MRRSRSEVKWIEKEKADWRGFETGEIRKLGGGKNG